MQSKLVWGIFFVLLANSGLSLAMMHDSRALEADPFHTLLYEKYNIQVPVFAWPHHNRRYLRTASFLYNSLEEYQYLAEVLEKEI